MVVLFLIFWGTSRLFSLEVVSFYSAINRAQRLQFLYVFNQHLFSLFVLLLCFWKPFWDRCEVISHCSFDLYIIFGEVSLQVLCLFSVGLFDFCCWVIGVPYIIDINPLLNIQFTNLFSHSISCLSLCCVFLRLCIISASGLSWSL